MTASEHEQAHPDRRSVLKGATAAGLAALVDPVAGALHGAAPPQRSLIHDENEKPGTTDWMLKKTRIDPKTKYRCVWIEGYCSATSVRAGDTLALMVSTNPPSPFVIDLYRLGYYQGKGGRHLLRLGPFKGKVQPDPKIGKQRLRRGQPGDQPRFQPVLGGDCSAPWTRRCHSAGMVSR
jgi:hypothetical protein